MWKPLMYDPNFSISDRGEIRNNKFNFIVPISGYKRGYPYITIFINGRPRKMYIHIEVARHFICDDLEGMQVHHKNHDRSDASVNNLQVLPISTHMSLTRMESNNGMSEKLVRMICNDAQKAYLSFDEINKKYALGKGVLKNIIMGKTYKHITQEYDFSDLDWDN